MRGRAVRLLLVLAFGIAIGHFAWATSLGPPPVLSYSIGGDVPIFSVPDSNARKLYLRRQLYLPVRPRHAWIQVLGYDHLRLYVNEFLAEEKQFDGFTLAMLVDLAPYLRVGNNVIGIFAEQTSIGNDRIPVVSVDGGYSFANGDEFSLGETEPPRWRCNTFFERNQGWWFTLKFKDSHWPRPQVSHRYLRGKVNAPPDVVKQTSKAKWITSPALSQDSAALRHDFTIDGSPAEAWMRVQSIGSHRLAINGILLDQREDQLDTTAPAPPVKRYYNITPLVHAGSNVVSTVVTRTSGQPFFMADMGGKDTSGNAFYSPSDNRWLAQAGLPTDWFRESPDDPKQWQPCHALTGDLDIMPYQPQEMNVIYSLPFTESLRRWVLQTALIAAIAVLAWVVCRMVYFPLAALGGKLRSVPVTVVYIPLALPVVALAGAFLAAYDPRIDPHLIYRNLWVLCALAAVPVQWLFLTMFIALRGRGLEAVNTHRARRWNHVLAWAAVLVLAAVGFWVRMRDISTEPLMWDEVRVYDSTMGVLKRGYPSVQIHPDVPIMYTATSELVYYVDALVALCYNNDIYVTRFPQVCWSTLTIILLYVMGRRMFQRPVGLMAAALYTFSPVAIAMSDFGRYFDQLQFFTLLCLYYFWLTIRGTGPLSTRAMWLCVVSFIAMFLSWEGGALIVPGMILAALLQRRGQLRTLLLNKHVWLGMVLIGTVAITQYSLRVFQQTSMLVYGTGISDLKLKPMWPYAIFSPWYYVWESAWSLDALLPMAGLVGAALLAINHRYKRPVRYLLITLLSTCWIMAAILPLIAWRYVHHLIPLAMLAACAAFIALAQGLVRAIRKPGLPAVWLSYGRAVATVVPLSIVVLCCGMTLRCCELEKFRILGYEDTLFKFPDLAGPTKYVREHLREGDIVICTHPHSATHFMIEVGKSSDYWIESVLQLQALLGNSMDVLRDRRSGATMLSSLEMVEDVFARHPRVWYIMVPQAQTKINNADVSAFIRQNMEIVYEDVVSMVLFWGDQHFPAKRRFQDDQVLFQARSAYIQ
jgi:4-amino-4-deoxy-L-arabinose transferase-like glycosyltransferase